jgi:phospholipase C
VTDNSSAVSRRTLFKGAAGLGAAAAASVFLPPNVRKALASTDAPRPGEGSINDIEHVVFLMQENRSFDEYFGTFPGVRGFGDPNAMKLPNGNSVFQQPDAAHADGYLLPFHMDTQTTSAQAVPGTAHDWGTQHQAWDNGAMDAWVAAKGAQTMGYFKQADIPFHWALASAFTLCDAYHCSVLGPTNPNRLYMWSGMLDPNGTGGGPVTDDSPAYNNPYCTWTTYPERLTAAGITWQVYQEYDNYDDNSLEWFHQYATADHESVLWQSGMVRKPAGWFEDDALNDRLPQVSWLVAPSAQCEHPDWTAAAGAQYIASKIDAIAANPKVWAKTVFILMYDENDGYFDHVLPPTAPAGTADEYVDGVPIGLGFRVPCTIVSPWTVGGYVATETFDHTSLIRLLETRFGVTEPNISAWRRQTVGDLTSAFQFSQPRPFPAGNQALSVPSTTRTLLAAQQEVADNPAPTIPAVNTPPVQDTTSRTGYLRPSAS